MTRAAPRSAGLSGKQKARLCMVAREAFARSHGRGPAGEAELAEWRHGVQLAACGRESLRSCTQADYNLVLARFLDLSGEPGLAMNALVAHQVEGPAVAMASLEKACAGAGVGTAYAAAIARNKFRLELRDCSEKQLWQLVFTMRKRPKRDAHDDNENPF